MERTLGGDRLGSGKKNKVYLHGYGRSNNDEGYLFRTSMSFGTLVPFLKKVALPGDTWDIHLDCNILTQPTIGPLFGSAKIQLDVFLVPMRFYNSLIHNNKLNIGMTMNKVFMPVVEFKPPQSDPASHDDIDNYQINPSCIWSYLGIRGVWNNDVDPDFTRTMNATPLLAYWDIYKNYYANKQEGIGMVVHYGNSAGGAIGDVNIYDQQNNPWVIPEPTGVYMTNGYHIEIEYPAGQPNLDFIEFQINTGTQTIWVPAKDLATGWVALTVPAPDRWRGQFNSNKYGQVTVYDVRQNTNINGVPVEPQATAFDLTNLDDMREAILAFQSQVAPYKINSLNKAPYSFVANTANPQYLLATQEGLALKTYQSDLFNNWLDEEFVESVTDATSISTAGDSFTIDTLNLTYKVYQYLNRIMVSGGSFRDWMDSSYDHEKNWIPETPVYMGGLIKELVFQEVISNAQQQGQPLGTLGGRGVMGRKHKGGHVVIKVDEPSYIIGLVSATPRIDYSQGNDWDMYALQTWQNLHVPAMDEIGFQDLITEQMAWWSTSAGIGGTVVQRSAGKQPAWQNYRTSVNKSLGNFAIENNEMFMTFNRRYEFDEADDQIADLTTYIDPVKFNYIFAETSLDAQNLWCHISVDIESRKKISQRVIPNL